MTPEELETLILESRSPKRVQEALAPLTEPQRRKLSTAAQKLLNQLERGTANKDASEKLKNYLRKRSDNDWVSWDTPALRNCIPAIFAVCPISFIKKRDALFHLEDRKIVSQIVLDRQPGWLDEWVAHDLEQDFSNMDFPMLRRWIKNGVCRRPTTDAYYVLYSRYMIGGTRHERASRLPLSKRLLREPDLLEDVWKIFQINNAAFDINPEYRKEAPRDYEAWPDALAKLSESGHLDRQKLLDASLEGLSQVTNPYQLEDFHQFHKRLKPDKTERANRQEQYLMLLSHDVNHVLVFALDMAGQLEKDGTLDTRRFLSEAQSVWLQDKKGSAVKALKFIEHVLENHPDHALDALQTVAGALMHANPDVQELAIGILDHHRSTLSGELREWIWRYADFVPASVQAALSELCGMSPAEEWSAEPQEGPAAETVEDIVSRLSAREFEALRIGEMLDSDTQCYLPIFENVMAHVILPTVTPLEPITDVDELIALTSHAAEIVETPDTVERIIDGVSRLCSERPSDFEGKAAPLIHRLEQYGSDGSKGIVGIGEVQLVLAEFLITWLTSASYRLSNRFFTADARFEPMIAHLRSIAKRVSNGVAQPLLSAPTHAGGWIDPLIWVERLRDADKAGVRFEPIDVCFSLLRLAPDNRAAALSDAEKLSGSLKRVAVFALGGEARPTPKDREQYDLWISAARARDPYANWRGYLTPLKVRDPWPDGSMPAQYSWRAYCEEGTRYSSESAEVYKDPCLEMKVGVESRAPAGRAGKALPSHPITDWERLPSAALNQWRRGYHFWGQHSSAWLSQWLPYYWPLNPSAPYTVGAMALADRIDVDGSYMTPGYGYLSALFQKNRPWREPGHLVLCLGLVGKDADARGLAVDANIEGIESGQFDPGLFAAVLAKLSDGGWLSLKRLGDNFLQVIQVSPLHAWVIGDGLQTWLASTDVRQRNMYRILEILLEALVRAQQPVQEGAREKLETLKGSSKSAKLAGKILSMDFSPSSSFETVKRLAISMRAG